MKLQYLQKGIDRNCPLVFGWKFAQKILTVIRKPVFFFLKFSDQFSSKKINKGPKKS